MYALMTRYELSKRHNHLVSAKYGVAKLNFALHVAYMPSHRLWRLNTPLVERHMQSFERTFPMIQKAGKDQHSLPGDHAPQTRPTVAFSYIFLLAGSPNM